MKISRILCLLLLYMLGSFFLAAQNQKEEPAAPPKANEEKKDAKKKDETKDPMVLETMTVTATKVATELMKTPVAISAFDAEMLEQKGVQNVTDLANMVPNMDIATINGQSTPMISMRGVRSTNETELGDPAVGVHLDGVYSPRMQGILGLMFDNERVEVLRGPQGTLFGRNSTVGNINIISSKPDFSGQKGSVNLNGGNFNAREFQGMFNYPVNEKLAFRVAGRILKRDSYLDGYWDPNQYDQRFIADLVADAPVINPADGPARTQHSNWWIDWADGGSPVRALVPADKSDFYMNADEYAYRVSARYLASEKLSIDLSYQKFLNDSAGGIDLVNVEKLRGRPVRDENGVITGTSDGANLFPEDNTYQAVVNVPGKLFLDIQYLRTNIDWDINDNLNLVYLAGLETQKRESAQDMEQSLNAWDGAMFFLPGTGSDSWSHEIQLKSYGDKKFNWIAGANMFHEKTSTLGYYDNSINDKALWDQGDRSSDTWSLFAQGTYSFTDQWHVTVGVRHSDETKEDVGGKTWTLNNDNGGPGWWARGALNSLPTDAWESRSAYSEYSSNDNKGSWNHDDWRVGLDYQLDDNTLIYSYLATGFKAGGIGDVFHETNPRTGEEINVRTSFNPEEVTTLEIGFKSKLLNGRLNLQGSYFFSDYKSMQYASVGGIAFTDRWQALLNTDNTPVLDENGNPVMGWVTAPIIAYYTQNVPGAEIQGFEFEYDWKPWAGGRINGYISWLDTEIVDDWITKWNYDAVSYFGIVYEESVDPTNELLQVNLKGNDLAVSPPYKVHLNFEHVIEMGSLGSLVPWFTAHWEDDSYLTIWNVDKHTDDMDFVILDEDIKYTDDKREAFYTLQAGVRFYHGNWSLEAYGYNLTDEVIQYWGGAAEGVAKGSFSMPRTFGMRFNYKF